MSSQVTDGRDESVDERGADLARRARDQNQWRSSFQGSASLW